MFPFLGPALKLIQSTEERYSGLDRIDENLPFIVEAGGSEFARRATLNQGGRPFAFFSFILQKDVFHHPS